jgi:hypothetical protein
VSVEQILDRMDQRLERVDRHMERGDRLMERIIEMHGEQRAFIREMTVRHERFLDGLTKSMDRTFTALQAEIWSQRDEIRASTAQIRANTEETRAQTRAVLRLLDRFGPADASA